MPHTEEIVALNAEARRRGTSYGKLVASTTVPERWEIVQKYRKAKEAQVKRKRKKTAAP